MKMIRSFVLIFLLLNAAWVQSAPSAATQESIQSNLGNVTVTYVVVVKIVPLPGSSNYRKVREMMRHRNCAPVQWESPAYTMVMGVSPLDLTSTDPAFCTHNYDEAVKFQQKMSSLGADSIMIEQRKSINSQTGEPIVGYRRLS